MQTTEVPICVSVIAEPDDGRAVPIMVEATPAAVGISPGRLSYLIAQATQLIDGFGGRGRGEENKELVCEDSPSS